MYKLLSRGRFYRRCVPPSAKNKNHSNIAGLALQPGSSSLLEIHVSFRAGGLRWCIAVREVLLCYREKKNCPEAARINRIDRTIAR